MFKSLIKTLATQEGPIETPVEGLQLYRLDSPFAKTTAVIAPSICFIAQGHKALYYGDNQVDYGGGQFLLGSLKMPIESELKDASPERPYYGAILTVDSSIVSELLFHVGSCEAWQEHEAINAIIDASAITPEIDSALVRLLSLQDPMDAKVLKDGLLRELYYHILKSPIGYMLRNSAAQHSKAHQIAPAIQYIEKNFTETITIDDLTKVAAMSATSLHEAFKKTTSLSPIQFIKKLRLHNAYMLLTTGSNATESAFASGYSSPAQFSREFKRQFGVSPSEVRVA